MDDHVKQIYKYCKAQETLWDAAADKAREQFGGNPSNPTVQNLLGMVSSAFAIRSFIEVNFPDAIKEETKKDE